MSTYKTKYSLQWDYYNDLEKGLRAGFNQNYVWYMILLKKNFRQPELVYIGMTLSSPSDRLLQGHEALKSSLREMKKPIAFAFGYVVAQKASSKVISENRVKEIESFMIGNFKPRLNGVGVKGYTGKLGFNIHSSSKEKPNWDILNWETK